MEELIKYAGIGIPVILIFLPLEIHFQYKEFNTKAVINGLAAIGAFWIYKHIKENKDITHFIASPSSLFYFIISAVLVIAYLTIFFLVKEKIKNGSIKDIFAILIIMGSAILYISFFGTYQMAFGLDDKFKNYTVISGQILDKETNMPIKKEIKLLIGYDPVYQENDEIATTKKGFFKSVVADSNKIALKGILCLDNNYFIDAEDGMQKINILELSHSIKILLTKKK